MSRRILTGDSRYIYHHRTGNSAKRPSLNVDFWAKLVCFAHVVCLALVQPTVALAQDAPPALMPLEVFPDPNGMNLLTGKIMLDGNIGMSIPADSRLTYRRGTDYNMYVDGNEKTSGPIGPDIETGGFSVNYGTSQSESFKCASSCFAEGASSSSLSHGPFGVFYTQEKTGIRYNFMEKSYYQTNPQTTVRTSRFYVSKITYPDGEQLYFQYDIFDPNDPVKQFRTRQVNSNTGYVLKFEYWGTTSSAWGLIKTATIYAVAAPTTPLANYPIPPTEFR